MLHLVDAKHFVSIVKETSPGILWTGKCTQKKVDPKQISVYIHECHPFKGELRRAILRTHLVLSRILLSWGSSVDAPVRFQESTGMGKPGELIPGTALCITDMAERVFLACESASRFLNSTRTLCV